MQFQNWGPNDKSDTIKFIQDCIIQIHHQPRLQYNFAIELKETQKLIGSCGAYRRASELQKVMIGYILNPDYWRQGLGAEAVSAMLDYLKSQLKITDISATCDSRNIASKHLLEKLDFALIETIVQDYEQKGFWRDTLVYKLKDSNK